MNDSRPDQSGLLAALRELPEEALIEKLHDIAAEEARLATRRALVQACLARHLPGAGQVSGTRLLTAKDVHEILGVPVAYVYELMRRGVLACTAIGKYRRVDPTDLEAFRTKNRLQPREDAEYSPRGARRTMDKREQPPGRPGRPRGSTGASSQRRVGSRTHASPNAKNAGIRDGDAE
jgi:excisionase family DNA binding protein